MCLYVSLPTYVFLGWFSLPPLFAVAVVVFSWVSPTGGGGGSGVIVVVVVV